MRCVFASLGSSPGPCMFLYGNSNIWMAVKFMGTTVYRFNTGIENYIDHMVVCTPLTVT